MKDSLKARLNCRLYFNLCKILSMRALSFNRRIKLECRECCRSERYDIRNLIGPLSINDAELDVVQRQLMTREKRKERDDQSVIPGSRNTVTLKRNIVPQLHLGQHREVESQIYSSRPDLAKKYDKNIICVTNLSMQSPYPNNHHFPGFTAGSHAQLNESSAKFMKEVSAMHSQSTPSQCRMHACLPYVCTCCPASR